MASNIYDSRGGMSDVAIRTAPPIGGPSCVNFLYKFIENGHSAERRAGRQRSQYAKKPTIGNDVTIYCPSNNLSNNETITTLNILFILAHRHL